MCRIFITFAFIRNYRQGFNSILHNCYIHAFIQKIMTLEQEVQLRGWREFLVHYNLHGGSVANSIQVEWLHFYNSLNIEPPKMITCGACYDYVCTHLYAQLLELDKKPKATSGFDMSSL